MGTRKSINPHPGSGIGSGTKEKILKDIKDVRPVSFKLLLIMSGVFLLLTMVLPLALSLGMKLEFHSSLVTGMHEGVMDGADEEIYVITDSSEYEANFVPSKLEELNGEFMMLEFFYGPLMLTGSRLDFEALQTTGDNELTGWARLGYRNLGGVIVTFLVYLLFLFLMESFLRNPGSALSFVPVFAIVWLIYGLIMWALGGLLTAPIGEFLNGIMTEEQGAADFRLSWTLIFSSAIRIFFAGMLYWLVKHQMIKPREPGKPEQKVPDEYRGMA